MRPARPQVAAALEAVGLNREARAQDLSLEQFAELAWALERGRGGGGGPAAAPAAASRAAAADAVAEEARQQRWH